MNTIRTEELAIKEIKENLPNKVDRTMDSKELMKEAKRNESSAKIVNPSTGRKS